MFKRKKTNDENPIIIVTKVLGSTCPRCKSTSYIELEYIRKLIAQYDEEQAQG